MLSAENIASAKAASLELPFSVSSFHWPGGNFGLVETDGGLAEIQLEPLQLGALSTAQGTGRLLSLSPDGAVGVFQGGDGGLFLWKRADQSTRTIPNGGVAYFATFSPDGKTIAIGSPDTWQVKLFDAQSLRLLNTLTGFQTAAPVYTAYPGPAGTLVAWNARATIQIQDATTGVMGAELNFTDFVSGLAFSPNGRQMIVSAGALLQVVNPVEQGVQAHDIWSGVAGEIYPSTAGFSADGKLAAAGIGGQVWVWETQDWTLVAKLNHGGANVRLVSFSPDGRALVSLDDQNLLNVWQVRE